jgi:hypothetical protein
MNSETIKMFGPCIADPSRIVNRDIAACDELAYKAAGYKRGSIAEVAEPAKPESPKQEVDLSKMTKAQLVAEAERVGVTVVPDEMTKAQIVGAIEEAAKPVEAAK